MDFGLIGTESTLAAVDSGHHVLELGFPAAQGFGVADEEVAPGRDVLVEFFN